MFLPDGNNAARLEVLETDNGSTRITAIQPHDTRFRNRDVFFQSQTEIGESINSFLVLNEIALSLESRSCSGPEKRATIATFSYLTYYSLNMIISTSRL